MRKMDERIAHTLADQRYADNVGMVQEILADMADVLDPELDNMQRAAIGVAKQFVRGEVSDVERLAHLGPLCDRMDAFLRRGTDNSRSAIINRIVAGSLMTNDGLSDFMADFIVDMAEDLNFEERKLIEIFSRHVPGFGEPNSK